MRKLWIALALMMPVAAGCSGAGDATESSGGGVERVYYIAADQVAWDYAPDGKNLISGEEFGDDENVFVGREKDRVGSKYVKCIYRGYTDDSFTELTKRPAGEEYLGFLGPVIRAEVGDTIKVVFKNNCSFPTSIHPHGVKYDKDGEGAEYSDDTADADKHDDAVPPKGTHTYNWEVPERAGPGPMEGSSAAWMYHSHSDEIGDVYAGLTGFMTVSAKGKANEDGSPNDVDREVFSLFEVVDENSSPLLDANLEKLKSRKVDVEDEDFGESNLMHAVNGFVYGNGPQLTLKKGEKVRWYSMGMGTEVDLHTPHWHGNTAVAHGMRTDVVNLLPAGMVTADMTPDATGTWLFHCHVADHIAAGMQVLYKVIE